MIKKSVKVLSWNIDRNESDISLRFENIVKVIIDSDADIVCLQENIKSPEYNVSSALVSSHGYTLVGSSKNDANLLVRGQSSFKSIFNEETDDYLTSGFVTIFDQAFLVSSAHLTWGTGKENVRLREVIAIEKLYLQYTELDPFRTENRTIGILCGDLNTEPDSASIRFLKGLGVENNMSTMWTDSWVLGNGPGITSSSKNVLAKRTATSVGLERGNLPERRIDYVMVRGFAYSRPGEILSSKLVGDHNTLESACSDHYGILTEIRL